MQVENITTREFIDAIERCDRDALEALYNALRKHLARLRRLFDEETAEDLLHIAYIESVESIQRYSVSIDPLRLFGYLKTIVRRTACSHIKQLSQSRKNVRIDEHDHAYLPLLIDSSQESKPDASCIRDQNLKIARAVFRILSADHQELLLRFYILEQPREQIEKELNIDPDTFRRNKSHAKMRFEKLFNEYVSTGKLNKSGSRAQPEQPVELKQSKASKHKIYDRNGLILLSELRIMLLTNSNQAIATESTRKKAA